MLPPTIIGHALKKCFPYTDSVSRESITGFCNGNFLFILGYNGTSIQDCTLELFGNIVSCTFHIFITKNRN